jgi:glycosyltransferase involved in cell wall biosynthesis
VTKFRTLVLAEGLPYPARVGKDLRNWQNICGLSSISQVGVFGLCSNDPRIQNCPPRRLEFWRSSTDAALTYPPPKHVLAAAEAWPLSPEGHPSDLYYSDKAAGQIADVMASFKPQLVVVENVWLYRYIDVLKQFRCRIVLDCHNVDGALSQEIADAAVGDKLPARLVRKLLPGRTKMMERKAVQSVDQIWVCSHNDARLMQDLYGVPKQVRVVPNGIDVARYEAACSRPRQRPEGLNPNAKLILFPAIFGYKPNVLAAFFLIREFFPRLASVFPDCQLLLAGDRPTIEMIAEARQEPRIVVTGGVPDMRPYFAAASTMVVPLFQGGGTRFKILEAFASKVPVISTAKGAEGLAVQEGKHLLLAETAAEFVDAVKRLWTEDHLAKQLAANGLELVKQSYSAPVITQQIAMAIDQLSFDR